MAMFSRDSDKPTKTSSSSSVIGTEMQINGSIKCSGSLVLKGKVKGNVECDNINISSEGNLKGNIKALQSSIGGNFEGDVFADSLSIESTANIKGKLHYNNLKAQPGANLEVELIRGLDNNKTNQTKTKQKRGK
tara:strand:- start:115 stop:516 length:402 start_codon:yes stop_codon:yes gene_type:complete